MKGTLGLIEVTGLSLAITVADVMVKRASVELSEIENSNGSGWMLVKVSGDYASVQVAIDSATEYAKSVNGWIASRVIARPGFELFGMSSYPPVPIDSEHHQPTSLAIGSDKSVVEQLSDDTERASELFSDLGIVIPPPETTDSELFMVQDLDAETETECSAQTDMPSEFSDLNQTDWLFDTSGVAAIQIPDLSDITNQPEVESSAPPFVAVENVSLAEPSILSDSMIVDLAEDAVTFNEDSISDDIITEDEILLEVRESDVEANATVGIEVSTDVELTMTAAEWVNKPKPSRKATLASVTSAVAPSSRIYSTAKQANKSAGRHICKVCFDPECTRKKREPHSCCIHAND